MKNEPKKFNKLEGVINVISAICSGTLAGNWIYKNADGFEAFRIFRFDTEGGGKQYRPVHPVQTDSGVQWAIGDPPGLLPLYRVNELPEDGIVFITEGEKAADEAWKLGLPTVTSSHGSKSAKKSDWSPLARRQVVILPDADDPGSHYAEEVCSILHGLNPPATVTILQLPLVPDSGEDIVEFAEQRRGAGKDDESIASEIRDMAAKVELEIPQETAPSNWDYEPFPVEMLPEPVRGFVTVAARSMGCDPAFVAVPLLATLASAIGNTRQIQLKRGWCEPPVLWTVIVGESGTMKSPALEKSMAFIQRRQQDAMDKYEDDMKQYTFEKEKHKEEFSEWKEKWAKSGRLPPKSSEHPICERFLVSDITVEALASILSHAPRGLILVRDELSGWLKSFNQYKKGQGGDSAIWLEIWRAGPMVIDRKSGDKTTINIPRAAVCIAGGIQPGALARALGREHFEDGMAARLLLAMPPRRAKRWTDDEIPQEIENALEKVFDKLYSLDFGADASGCSCPVTVKLTPEGQKAWKFFYNAHNKKQVELSGDIAAAWSKLEAYAARFALVIHLVRWAAGDATLSGPNQVDKKSVAAAVELVRWFGREAKRVYAVVGEDDEEAKSRQLVNWIRLQEGAVTARDLARKYSDFRNNTEAAKAALITLEQQGLGKLESLPPGAKGGRPSMRFVLYPSPGIDNTTRDVSSNGGSVTVATETKKSSEVPDGGKSAA